MKYILPTPEQQTLGHIVVLERLLKGCTSQPTPEHMGKALAYLSLSTSQISYLEGDAPMKTRLADNLMKSREQLGKASCPGKVLLAGRCDELLEKLARKRRRPSKKKK